jgi:hypothetical protein
VVIGVIRPTFEAGAPPAQALADPVATSIKARVWAGLVAAGRFLRMLPKPQPEGATDKAS